jgi:alkanesulfonate monooxygenase
MVAGGSRTTSSICRTRRLDLRYARLEEYTAIICGLLRGTAPVSLAGRFYNVRNLTLQPGLPPELFPGLYLSGSSDAGRAAATATGSIAVEYPQPGGSYAAPPAGAVAARGMRIGIITAADDASAWQLARERFPEDRRGQIAHRVAMKVSDSAWHADLAGRGEGSEEHESPYWLGPFQNYQTFCPYLVGSHERVASEIATYLRAGFRTFILDIPRRPQDVEPLPDLFRRAETLAG